MHTKDILFFFSSTLIISAVLASPIPKPNPSSNLLDRRDNTKTDIKSLDSRSEAAIHKGGLNERGGPPDQHLASPEQASGNPEKYKAAPGEQNPSYTQHEPPPAPKSDSQPASGVGSSTDGHSGPGGAGPTTGNGIDNPDGSVNSQSTGRAGRSYGGER